MRELINSLLNQTIKAYHAKEYNKCFLLLNKILGLDSKNIVALNILAAIHSHNKNYSKAIEIFKKVLKINPNNNLSHYNLGKIYLDIQNFNLAFNHLAHAAKLENSHAQTWLSLGICLIKLNKKKEALDALNTSLIIDTKNINTLVVSADLLDQLEIYDKAIEFYEKIIMIEPKKEFIFKLASLYEKKNNYIQGIEFFEKIVGFINEKNNVFYILGNLYIKILNFQDAMHYFDLILQSDQLSPDVFYNKAITLHALKRFSEALVHFDKALLLNPNFSDAWSNKALTLYKLNRYTEALSCLDQAILLNPENTMAWTNKGVLFIDLKKYYEAEECFKTAQKIDIGNVKNIYNFGLLQLSTENFIEGWKKYSSRWNLLEYDSKPLQTKKPAWLGEKSNSRIFIWGEQGVGDQILYSSMLNELKLFPQKKILSVNKKLLPIFRRSFSGFTFLDKEEIVSEDMYDEQLPLGSLGQFFRRSVKDFESSQFPYLCDDKKRTATILEKLQYLKNIKCGISWRSSNQEFGDHKSIGLLDLIPLFRRPGFSFINLQYGDIYDELDKFNQNHNIDISKVDGIDLFEDVDGVLSIIQACDIVITVSNSTAHLAGALGKKTYLLLSGGAGKFWYWHRQGEKSLWYPSIKIFEQKTVGDWTGVIDEVLDSLEKECVN